VGVPPRRTGDLPQHDGRPTERWALRFLRQVDPQARRRREARRLARGQGDGLAIRNCTDGSVDRPSSTINMAERRRHGKQRAAADGQRDDTRQPSAVGHDAARSQSGFVSRLRMTRRFLWEFQLM
jgi:hypothetical protein